MSEINDGGPAFPVSTSNENEGHQDGPNTWQFPGMTLRDYFAAKAMQAIVIGNNAGAGSMGLGCASDAYGLADAMLAARASSAQPAAEPEPAAPDDDGWIEWGGDIDAPVNGRVVEVQYRSGAVSAAVAGAYIWYHDGRDDDIVRYRVVREDKP